MKTESRIPRKLHIVRAALSIFIALVLFVQAPLQAQAATTVDLLYNYANQMLLQYSYSTKTGTIHSFTYSSPHTFPFRITLDSSLVGKYINGFLIVGLNLAAVQSSVNFNPDRFVATVNNVETPEGITVTSGVDSSTSSSTNLHLYIYFDNYYAPINTIYLGLTMDVSYSGWIFPDKFSNEQTAKSFTAVAYLGTNNLRGYADLWDINPFASYLRTAINLANTQIGNIFTAVQNQTTFLGQKLDSVNTNITNQSTAIQNKIQSQITNDNANTTKIMDKIQSQITNDNSNTTKITTALNTNSKSEIDAANKNSQNEINAANKNANDIMHDYDTTGQDSDNKKFADSQKELQETEDSLFSDALTGFSALDMSNYTIGGFTAVLGAFSFVSNFLQSLYLKMGDFGTIVTIGLVVMIATKVIGSYRFSTGGDSS